MPLTNLPLELRQAIWKFSLPTDDDYVPEVCIAWPLYVGGARQIERKRGFAAGQEPTRPFVVDVDFPVAMHVCHESRAFLQSKHSGMRFRESPAARCMVPFRRFRPELDIMHWSCWNAQYIMDMGGPRLFGHWWSEVRHLALDARGVHHPTFSWFIFDCLPKLETLSIVLADSSNNNSVREHSKPPTRRCRLRPIPEDVAQNMTLTVDYLGEKQCQSLCTFKDYIRKHLDKEGERRYIEAREFGPPMQPPFSGGYNPATGSFEKMEISVVTFVEYYRGGEWVEVCGDRKFKDRWKEVHSGGLSEMARNRCRYMPVAHRRDPEEYRVNDDDGAMLEQAGLF